MVGLWTWVLIPKEKSSKLDLHSWQGIFIGYEGKNQYRVYNLQSRKIYIIQDLFIDGQYLYHCEVFNHWNFSDDEWANTDDAKFAPSADFKLDSEVTFQYLSSEIIHQMEKNSSV